VPAGRRMLTLTRPAQKGIKGYARLRREVQEVLIAGQRKIEQEKVRTYWETGRIIHEHILKQKDRADYGRQVILKLAHDIEVSDSVLRRTVQFYQGFPISAAPRKLTWAHYCELLPIKEEETRLEMALQAERQQWTSEELRRKLREEFRRGNSKTKAKLQGAEAPLKPKRGTLYTYRLIQPDQVNPGKPYVLIDLGFQTSRRLYQSGLKAESIIESVWDEAKEDYRITKSARDESQLYTYKAVIERIVDGDTLRVKVDLGFDIWTRQYLRLRGIDCPEMNTLEGKKAKKFVETLLSAVTCVTICSSRSDKYDRYLADVYIPGAMGKGGGVREELFLNQRLLDEGLAVRM